MSFSPLRTIQAYYAPLIFLTLFGCNSQPLNQISTAEQPEKRPNILLIVADDMGYTDIGVYGGEINTPNLDQLARDGLILTDFHNQAVCAPTRAALLAGTDNHNAGGAMQQASNQRNMPGYESDLNMDVVAFPKLLQQSGYNTYWAGKWHLGNQPDTLPSARGFDKSFALMEGFASHYSDMKFSVDRNSTYFEDGQPVESLPDDFYSTYFYTDYIMDAIKADAASGDPWFAFLGYTTPHWPLHAPDDEIAKYKDVYDDGYEVLRQNRIEKAKELGVIPNEARTYPRLDAVPPWSSLSSEEKDYSSKEMEIYAAMVDVMDQDIGRLIQYLKDTGQYENTFIAFISDNGAEGQELPPNGFDNSLENIGRIHSNITYGPEWAQAGVGVMRYYKSLASEGGIRGPAILHYSNGGIEGVITDSFASVIDFAPTFLELAGVTHPGTEFEGRTIKPLQGHSMMPLVRGQSDKVWPEDFIFGWEVFGHLAIRKGDWKLLRLSSTPSERRQSGQTEGADYWGLYNMKIDPGEVTNLADVMPEKVQELMIAWEIYSSEHGLIIPEARSAGADRSGNTRLSRSDSGNQSPSGRTSNTH